MKIKFLNPSKVKKIFFSFLESIIRNISGGVGQRIRYYYYKNRFYSCGCNVKIDEGVIFQNPENMKLASDIWFMPYSIITAAPKQNEIIDRDLKKKINHSFNAEIGVLKIGSEVQIGAFNILQAYGGIEIMDRVTTSARVSIYSHSHYPFDEKNKSKITYPNAMIKDAPISCIESPIVLEKGVWLGLGVSVFAGTLGENCFITAGSIVLSDLEKNSYATGIPATKKKNRFEI